MRIYEFNTANTTTGAAGSTATLTFAAVPGRRHACEGIHWSISATPASTVTLAVYNGAVDAGNLVYKVQVTAGGPGILPMPMTIGSVNTALNVQLTGLAGTELGSINVLGKTLY